MRIKILLSGFTGLNLELYAADIVYALALSLSVSSIINTEALRGMRGPISPSRLPLHRLSAGN